MAFPAALCVRLVAAELAPGSLDRELAKLDSAPGSFVSGIGAVPELVTTGSLAGMSRTNGIALSARLAPHGIVRSRRPLLVAAMPWNKVTAGTGDGSSLDSDAKN